MAIMGGLRRGRIDQDTCMTSRVSILRAPVLLQALRQAALQVFALAAAEATHRLRTKVHLAHAAAGHEFYRAGPRRVQTRISWPPRASGFPFARSPGAIRLRCESFRAAHRPWGR